MCSRTATRTEDGFQPHLLLTVEEDGIPVQISKKFDALALRLPEP